MPGSKTLAVFHLVYDCINDKAYWSLWSAARVISEAQPYRWEIVDPDSPNYEVVSKMAGPKPEVLVEEVVQHEQGDSNEKVS